MGSRLIQPFAIRLLVALLLLAGVGCGHLSAPTGEAVPPTHTLSGGQTTGPLGISRIEITFPNRRGDITVPIRTELTAQATIRFHGNGLFRAVWRVDGRDLERVNLTITHGDTLHLPMARTALPTFEPGRHRVSLSILAPANAPPGPEVWYLVTP